MTDNEKTLGELMNTEVIPEFVDEVCDIYFRSFVLKTKGASTGQHAHDHNHATYIGNGSVRATQDGELLGEFQAGQAIPILAGKEHNFEALEDNTRLTCVHWVGHL